jgi:hypothetical protein
MYMAAQAQTDPQAASNLGEPASAEVSAPSPAAPAGGLATLLDRFTASLDNPQTHSVGEFAQTVQALHSELAFLAGTARASRGSQTDEIDFDAIFPVEVQLARAIDGGLDDHHPDSIYSGEELEDLCRRLSA